MGARGPQPVPTQLKILRGNPGHQKLNKSEPKPAPLVPNCPTWLDKEAKREWRRIVEVLDAIGLLTLADMSVLAGYCQAYSNWMKAEKALIKEGFVMEVTTKTGIYLQQRPEVSIAQRERASMLSFGARLGLSPSDRGRMTLPDAPNDEESPFD